MIDEASLTHIMENIWTFEYNTAVGNLTARDLQPPKDGGNNFTPAKDAFTVQGPLEVNIDPEDGHSY